VRNSQRKTGAKVAPTAVNPTRPDWDAAALGIALVRRQGLDQASSEEKYRLRSPPNESFSALHLMCLISAAFRRFAPEQLGALDRHCQTGSQV